MAKILVIDDDPDMRFATRLALESAGYNVVEAQNTKESLAQVKAEHPDLIVLDVMMETATAGFQLALQLRSRDPKSDYVEFRNTPIIMLTAIHETTQMRFQPDEDFLPVDAFVEKPINPQVFLPKVEALLAKAKNN